MVCVVQQARDADRVDDLMCPHDCDTRSPIHKPGCVWRPGWTPTGSRVQAVPRQDKGETK